MMIIFMFHCGHAGNHLYKRRNTGRRNRPPSAADFFDCFDVSNTDAFLEVHDETWRVVSYLIERIYFEAQSCSEIATFKDKSQTRKRTNKYVWQVDALYE